MEKSELVKQTNQRKRMLIKVVTLIRHDCRDFFGVEFADRWGFFVDYHLSSEIHSYLDWVEYPKGDHVLTVHRSQVNSAIVSSNGCFAYTSDNKHIREWDLRSNQEVRRWHAHSDTVHCLDLHSTTLVSGSYDHCIKLWDCSFQECRLRHTLALHSEMVNSVRFDPSGKIVASSSDDKTIRIWSVKSGICLSRWTGHSNYVLSAMFIGDGRILSGSHDCSLKLWAVAEGGRELATFTEGIGKPVYNLAMNCDSTTLVCTLLSGFCVFRWPKMTLLHSVEVSAYCAAFHPSDPDILAVGLMQSDDLVLLYQIGKGTVIRELKGHSDSVYSVCFTPDGQRLLSTSEDKTVRVWDVSDLI